MVFIDRKVHQEHLHKISMARVLVMNCELGAFWNPWTYLGPPGSNYLNEWVMFPFRVIMKTVTKNSQTLHNIVLLSM